MATDNVWDDPRLQRGAATQLAARDELLGSGAKAIGWKVAFSAPPPQESLGITGSVTGFLTDRTVLASGAECSVAGWANPVLEPEITIHVGPGGEIRALGAAIELADLSAPLEDLEAIVAGNIFHRAVILGPAEDAYAGGDPAGIAVRVERDGEEIAATEDPTAAVGDPREVARHVGEVLAAIGAGLSDGDVVITGSVVPAIPVAPGQRIRCDFGALGVLEVSLTD